jgi:hypothetical protein
MTSESKQQKIPKVFISYSYDSDNQMDRVLALSDRLREDGIDCNIDQYEQSPMKGWHSWRVNEIEESDFVLMICTPQYIRRFRGNEEDDMSMGVPWEGSVVTRYIYSQAGQNSKYIPILFALKDAESLPNILRSDTHYLVSNSKGYELLYRRLTNQHENQKADLGKFKTLPPRDRKQFFTADSEINIIQKDLCNLPRKSYSKFIGRKKEVAQLLEWISPEHRPYMHVVRGIGGVGKTALVLEVAHQCWDAKKDNINNQDIPTFDAIIFTSSKATDLVNTKVVDRPEKEPMLKDIFRVIADVLNEPTVTQSLAKEQQKQANQALGKQSTLLIVDNLETLLESEREVILSFLNNVPTSTQVIITTREYVGFDGIAIHSLNKEESFDLLERQAKLKQLDLKNIRITNEWKTNVHKLFSGIPIALIYAIGQLAAGYRTIDVIDPGTDRKYLGKFCFESSITLIKNKMAYQLLISMTFFRDSPCREALIKVAGLTDGNQDTIDALAKLQQLSLITEERGRYSILSITREYAISELEKIENAEFKRSARERWYDWYLNFTEQYGGEDWDGWRARYDRLKKEWENIESVLNWYADKEEFTKVLQLWENVDNYVDLSGYWQKRRDWWAYLGKRSGSTKIKVKALSEKGLTLTLMGKESYKEAEKYLNNAWGLREDADNIVQATVANHLAVLTKIQGDYSRTYYWLDIEKKLLDECQILNTDKQKKRYLVRNIYYRAETHYLDNKIDLARDGFIEAINLSREIGWQRFKNYAKNWLAEIYIIEDKLELAAQNLKSGLSAAKAARESRRIALYQATYARLYYRLSQKSRQNNLIEESIQHIEKSKDYADQAFKVFSKEFMIAEKDEITNLLTFIQNER